MTSKASAALSAAIHGHNPIAAASSTDDAGKSKPKLPLPPKVDIPVPSAADHASAPKTPADEAIDFFESAPLPGDAPIQVYELKLEEDGGPNKSKAVRLDLSPFLCKRAY